MKRIALVLAALAAAAAFAPAFASTNDPTSPFYLLPTSSQGTTLHGAQAGEPAAERK
jgi:hypothetical protein